MKTADKSVTIVFRKHRISFSAISLWCYSSTELLQKSFAISGSLIHYALFTHYFPVCAPSPVSHSSLFHAHTQLLCAFSFFARRRTRSCSCSCVFVCVIWIGIVHCLIVQCEHVRQWTSYQAIPVNWMNDKRVMMKCAFKVYLHKHSEQTNQTFA